MRSEVEILTHRTTITGTGECDTANRETDPMPVAGATDVSIA